MVARLLHFPVLREPTRCQESRTFCPFRLASQLLPSSSTATVELAIDLPRTRKSSRPCSRGLPERERLPEHTAAVFQEAVTGHLQQSCVPPNLLPGSMQ